jgi:hypothetical protein
VAWIVERHSRYMIHRHTQSSTKTFIEQRARRSKPQWLSLPSSPRCPSSLLSEVA